MSPVRERWTHLLLAALLFGHLFLLASRPQTEDSRLDKILLFVLGPVADSAVGVVEGVTGSVTDLRSRSELTADNARLRGEVAALERELVRLSGVEAELENLRRLSNALDRQRGAPIVADVVLADYATAIKSLVIDAGKVSLAPNQVVRTADGLVGRVVAATGSAATGTYAKVQLITDRSAAVSAMIARTRRKGVVRGIGGSQLHFDYLPRRADVVVGDQVVTAGIDGIFPRGIPVGTVVSVAVADDLFYDVEVVPAADFSRLDLVYVLPDDPLPDTVVEELDAVP